MRKKHISKLLSALISASVLLSAAVVPVFAQDGYFKFEEDFSGYTAENAHVGTSLNDAYYHYDGEKIIAQHESGAKWVTSEYWYGGLQGTGGVPGSNIKGAAYINTDKNCLAQRAWGDIYPAVTKLDMTGVYDKEDAGEVQRFTFKTGAGAKAHAVALYMSDDEKNFYLFGKATSDQTRLSDKHLPFVIKYVNGAYQAVALAEDLTAWQTETSTVTWTVTVIDKKISYKCEGANGAVWSGYFDDEDNYSDNWKYLAGYYTLGDNQNFLYNFKFETGEYYSGGMGEPTEVLYRNAAEGKSAAEENGEYIAEFDSAVPVRRVKSRALGRGGEFSLSEDGISWDSFNLDNSYTWFNDVNNKRYKFIKAARDLTARSSLFVFTECAENEDIIVQKGGSTNVYLYVNGEEVTDASWSVADARFAEITGAGHITGKKDGRTEMSVTKNGETKKINVICKGPMTIAIESEDADVMAAYIATQQAAIDRLNSAISANDTGAAAAFFTQSGGLSDIDAATELPDIISAEPSAKLDLFYARLMSYDGDFTVQSIDEIRQLEKELIRELKVSEVCGIAAAQDMKNAIAANEILGINTEITYYSSFENEILTALLNKNFANYADFEKCVNEAAVMANIKGNQNSDNIVEMCRYYINTIGCNEAKFNMASANPNTFGRSIINNRQNINSVTDLKNYVDAYTPASAPTVIPSSGGGGGGGGNKFTVKPTPTPAPVEPEQKTPEQPLVEKRVIFEDVSVDAWEYEAVRFLNAKNAVSGYEDGSFRSKNNVTRAEFIQILVTAMGIDIGEPAEDAQMPFEDIKRDDWFSGACVKAKELGILSGSDGKCMPQSNITKQEIAAMILRALNANNRTVASNVEIRVFADSDDIADWALEAVNKLQAGGIISGSDGYFNPTDSATRAEAAQMIYAALLKTGGSSDEN